MAPSVHARHTTWLFGWSGVSDHSLAHPPFMCSTQTVFTSTSDACVRVCLPACVHACVRACVRACVCACLRACVRACVRAFGRACACMWVSVPCFAVVKEYSTRDCGDCETCEPGFVNSEGQCLVSCDLGLFDDGSGVCQKCQPYCISCTDATTCVTCQITPKKYYLSGGDCVIPCTLPTDFGSNIVTDDAGFNGFACEAGEVLDESDACDIKCDDGFYVDNGGTTEYSCNPSGSTLTSATATCAACSGVLSNCLTCSAFDTCLTCESG